MSQKQELRTPAADPAADVRTLLSAGDTKQAVDRAKEAHKRLATPASEALLVEAYLARIQSLSQRGLHPEAKALTQVVWDRFPSARPSLAPTRPPDRVDGLEILLRPLADPDLPTEKRDPIEEAVRCDVTDLASLAACAVLPPDHPLRLAAAAVQAALAAVTLGPVDEAQVALPEVSRRSPLAPWKMLVRAIAAFYRRDDETCERALSAIDPDSAPARLVPAIRAMIAGTSEPVLRPLAASLARKVTGGSDAFRQALAGIDASFDTGKRSRILRAIERAVEACATAYPDLLPRLRQEVSVRTLLADIPGETSRKALGAPALRDPHFWRLHARAEEMSSTPFLACTLWEEFTQSAIDHGWFAEDSHEAACVALHMADLLRALPREEQERQRKRFRESFDGFAEEYADQPADLREKASRHKVHVELLDTDRLFERASRIDPDPETFRAWWEWTTEEDKATKEGDAVLAAWRRAVPGDARPLIQLAASAERRDALKKALGYVEEAERLNPLDPQVRKARVRLLVAVTLRHLCDQKLHLVDKDLAEIEALPQAREGRRPAFASIVRAFLAQHQGKEIDSATWRHEAALRMESEPAAFLLLWSIAEACGIAGPPPGGGAPEEAAGIAEATARACLLGEELGIEVKVPSAWEEVIRSVVAAPDCALDAHSLRGLAEAALRGERRELAYAISAAGLARRGPTTARFLFLRAVSLPRSRRRIDCAVAAASLAREQRDADLAAEAAKLTEGRDLDPSDLSVARTEIEQAIAKELEARAYPTAIEEDLDEDLACNCRYCRARKEAGGDEEEDEDDEVGDFSDPPPELNALFIEMQMKFGRNMPSPAEIERRDPDLADRLLRVLLKYGMTGASPFGPEERRRRR